MKHEITLEHRIHPMLGLINREKKTRKPVYHDVSNNKIEAQQQLSRIAHSLLKQYSLGKTIMWKGRNSYWIFVQPHVALPRETLILRLESKNSIGMFKRLTNFLFARDVDMKAHDRCLSFADIFIMDYSFSNQSWLFWRSSNSFSLLCFFLCC